MFTNWKVLPGEDNISFWTLLCEVCDGGTNFGFYWGTTFHITHERDISEKKK